MSLNSSELQKGGQPNANGNLFEIRTVQSAAFRTLIEALKEILTEANLEFDSTGIKVIDVDETHTVLTYLRLHADRFEYFYCPAKYILGINMILFSVSVRVVIKCRRIFVILTRVLDAMLSARKSSEELDIDNLWLLNRQPVVVESTTCGC
jgi:DNA polymerase III sliding clamp (beta) subunit (PCNA family)